MFIGENLNEKQVAALQAVADAVCGFRFALVESARKAAEGNSRHFRCLQNENDEVDVKMFNELVDQLQVEGLVERKEIKGKPHVGMTSDGKRCNLIDWLEM